MIQKQLSKTLSETKARKYIKNISQLLSKKYGILISSNENIPCGQGGIHCGLQGDYHITIGLKIPKKEKLFYTEIDTNYFFRCCQINIP